MSGGQAEFWRVLNASTNGFLALQVNSGGAQQLQVSALDGIPVTTPYYTTIIYLPPAGRAEFIVPPLTPGVYSNISTQGFTTGPIGDPMPGTILASIVIVQP
jgi:FtsP/CotA-like multicopper oxidase with cupredoxin domain